MSASGSEVLSPDQRTLVENGGPSSSSDADYQVWRSLIKCQMSSVKTRDPKVTSDFDCLGQSSLVRARGPESRPEIFSQDWRSKVQARGP